MSQPEQVASELGFRYDPDWRDRALCRHWGPWTFYRSEEIRPSDRRLEAERRAKQICSRCPVIGSCLSWAVANTREVGVWGGQTSDDRDATRRRLRRQRVRSESYGDNESCEAVQTA